ncbi:MAG: hypothetical protein OEM96_06955, partial [Gemmatimonadota bacterium]|nr:hypothetical protein [Gemmatimonadota bacterium]
MSGTVAVDGRRSATLRLVVASGLVLIGGLVLAPDWLSAAQSLGQDGGAGVRTFFGVSPRRVIWVV